MAAYRRTSFYTDTPRGRLCLRIGVPHAELDALLAANGARSWAYVTVWNPGSIVLSEAENVGRQHALEQALRDGGFTFWRGEGVGDEGRWPPEPSVLVLGITRAEAVALGGRFGQGAILYGEAGGCPQLLGC